MDLEMSQWEDLFLALLLVLCNLQLYFARTEELDIQGNDIRCRVLRITE